MRRIALQHWMPTVEAVKLELFFKYSLLHFLRNLWVRLLIWNVAPVVNELLYIANVIPLIHEKARWINHNYQSKWKNAGRWLNHYRFASQCAKLITTGWHQNNYEFCDVAPVLKRFFPSTKNKLKISTYLVLTWTRSSNNS